MKLKRDIFQRATRFTHRFGPDANDEPMITTAGSTFDPNFPVFPDHRSKALLKKNLGQHEYCEPMSPVVLPNSGRRASMNGPKPDPIAEATMAIPANTKKRTTNRPT